MAIRIQQPPEVHTAFNPVILKLQAESGDETENGVYSRLFIDGNDFAVFSEFFNSSARLELSEILKRLFDDIETQLPQSALCITDRKLTFYYRIETPGEPVIQSNHTAVNAVVQIGRNPDLSQWESRFLTNFHTLKKYRGYPLSVSFLNNREGVSVGFDGEKINGEAIPVRHFSINVPDGVNSITILESPTF